MDIGDLLNEYSEKKFSFPALNNPDCSQKDIIQTMDDLKEVPYYQRCDALRSRELIQQLVQQGMEICIRMLEERKLSIPQTSTDALNRYFLRTIIALQNKDWQEALRSLLIYDSYSEFIFSTYRYLYYYSGLAFYGMQEYEKAEEDFRIYISSVPQDETAHFYRGNALFFLGRYQETVEEYINALDRYPCFQEIADNTVILENYLRDSSSFRQAKKEPGWHDSPFEKMLAIPDVVDIWTIPIFINNFNRLECLKKLVEWLTDAGYRNIYVLDNNSTYLPLLEYYEQLDRLEPVVQVVRLGKNLGFTALWDSGILDRLSVASPYVYTDSDVVPVTQCPKNFLQQLMDILRRYPLLKKVGLGLKLDGITCDDAERIIAREQRYYIHEMEQHLYFGPVDTTFALYRNYRHYHLCVSARTTGNLMAWHLPWHYDYRNLPPDELYYAQHANASASLLADLKKKGQRW